MNHYSKGPISLNRVCRALFLMAIVTLFCASPARAESNAPVIRVGLAFEIESCHLSSPDGLELADAQGQSLSRVGDDISISAAPQDGFVVAGTVIPGVALIVRPQNASGAVALNGHAYRGQMVVLRSRHGRLNVVNYVGIEAYVVGVLAGEVPSTWPEESLKAQAVAARSYVLYQVEHHGGHDWDVYATDKDQVYDGTAGEVASILRAVHATRGEVLTYEGKIIKAYFHSTCGGHTEDAANVFGEPAPYLVGVADPYCKDAPYQQWSREFSAAYLRRVLSQGGRQKLGTLLAVKAGRRSASGRLQDVVIVYDGGQETIPAAELRRLLGYREMRSTYFDIRVKKSVAQMVAVRTVALAPVAPVAPVAHSEDDDSSVETIEPVTLVVRPEEGFYVIAGDKSLQTNRAGNAFAATSEGILRTFAMRPGLTIVGLLRHDSVAHTSHHRNDRVTSRPASGPDVAMQMKMVPVLLLFTGRGWGHGVGMCQWGARGMAQLGFGYRDILKHYYPTTQLMVLSSQ